MANSEWRADRQDARLDNQLQRLNQLEIQMAKFDTWRAEHIRFHERTDRQHADMPGRAIAAFATLISFLVFLFTFYSGGFGQ